MWPFSKKKNLQPYSVTKKLVTGLIIGGAIGSIVGSNALEKAQRQHKEEETKE